MSALNHLRALLFSINFMKDYLIVGFGLAGLAIAENLTRRNQSFLVIDDTSQKSSRVAGGAMNPVILKRFTKFWMADEFISEAEVFYQDLEKKLDLKLLHHIPIYRKFHSVREQNDWFFAADKPEMEEYLDSEIHKIKEFPSPYGFGKVNGVSILDTEKTLDAYLKELVKENKYLRKTFDYKALEIKSDSVRYKTHEAKKIIFCEGCGAMNNPWFNNLPIIKNKGMYLIIKKSRLRDDIIIRASHALVPLGNDCYKYGATYDREFSRSFPEAKDYNDLIESLEEIIDHPYSVLTTETGIRPTVKDRRPLVGRHFENERLLICNGLGAHGVMMAPAMARHLIEYELDAKAIPDKVDVNRYYTRKKKDLIHKRLI